MLLTSITFAIVCGLVSATPWWDYTPEERLRVLGPFASQNLRMDFPCTGLDPSPTVPTSVHKLRPADIKYVAAIGDSLTAASGANAGSIFGLTTQYRGMAWSIGGAETLDTTITLPNILRKCNKDIYGYSLGNGEQNSSNARLNLARPGAVSSEMPGQATLLINRMKSSMSADDFNNAWKLITFFIGGNDLCAYCGDGLSKYTPENYRANVKAALDIFHAQLPRTLVNFVTVLNVAELEDLHVGLSCQFMQGFLCDCAIDEKTRPVVNDGVLKYQAATNELISSGVYDTRDDFTVVIQPFMEHMTVPSKPDGSPDFSYFTKDCFHFSKKGHGAAAIELWNNMMEPVGKKTKLWNLAAP